MEKRYMICEVTQHGLSPLREQGKSNDTLYHSEQKAANMLDPDRFHNLFKYGNPDDKIYTIIPVYGKKGSTINVFGTNLKIL